MRIDKKIWIGLFALMVLAQLYIPASMIINQEEIITEGQMMRFVVAPLDPIDPFRGKYVQLSYKSNQAPVLTKDSWSYEEIGYAMLRETEDGYFEAVSVQKDKPEQGTFLKVIVESANSSGAWILFPFNRFYMDEDKALAAENLYFESLSDSSKTTYSVVYVKDGESVLQDVQIDGVSIADLVGEKLVD